MENLELLYSLFNQHVFQDAKNNIESLEYYFNTNPSTSGNPLIKSLLDAIRNYSYEAIDYPLFQSILQREGMHPSEQKMILDEVGRWRRFSSDQMAPTKSYLRDICADMILRKASNKFSGNPYEMYRYLKNSEIRLDNTDILSSSRFDSFDISKMVDEVNQEGYSSSFSWINDLFEPGHKYEAGQMTLISCPPGCMSGDTEVFLANGTTDTLENLYRKKSKNITVFSCDGKDPKVSVAEDCQISKYVDSWYVVEIDGKKEYRVTENHPFLMINGEWKRADELEPGDSLMPFNKRDDIRSRKSQTSFGLYTDIYTNNSKRRFKAHRLTGEYINIYLKLDFEYVAHHSKMKDGKFDRSDNSVESIKLMSNSEHAKFHNKFQKETIGLDSFIKGGEKTQFTSEQISERNRKMWKEDDYRQKRLRDLVNNGKITSSLFNSKSDNEYGTLNKILATKKYGKYLIDKFDCRSTEDLLKIWDEKRVIIEDNKKTYSISPRTPKKNSVVKYYGDKIDDLYDDCLSYNNHTITRVYVEHLDEPQPVYDLVNVDIYHNYAVKFDDNSGFFSHNTGKTLWMMTEALNIALTSNAKIHYLAMGDMKPRDFIIRMGAIYTGKPFGEVVKNLGPIYETLKNLIGDRLEISVIPAGQITSEDYVEYVRGRGFNVVFIDYDSNFKLMESESMYNDYGIVYNNLTKLTQDGRLVFVAAQPKVFTWTNPVIELGDVGESARKIHTVDILFTAGKFISTPNHVGIFKCCKNRRGEEGGMIGYIRLNNGRFKFIPIEVAKQLAEESVKKFYSESDIDSLVRQFENNKTKYNLIEDTIVGGAKPASKFDNPFKNR